MKTLIQRYLSAASAVGETTLFAAFALLGLATVLLQRPF